jgi:hypothetical protein
MGMRLAAATRYLFDTKLGRKGKGLVGGDEIEYLGRLARDGHRGVWIGTAPVDHFIPAERLTTGYVWEYYRCNSVVGFANFQDHAPRLFGLPRWLVKNYCLAVLRARLLSLGKSERWLNAFLESARWRGMLDVCQQVAQKAAVLTTAHSVAGPAACANRECAATSDRSA